ncbi:hypothetical protein B296_00051840 [Ensete ventricosum]|uniref:Uncharacterized protein n=1 Tax=Ensete ventricosum TaxID=4639 RepID=A0A426X7J9_ENSVE|nr:hypothetical protein B296_00051840 [Ensete ventricosum]
MGFNQFFVHHIRISKYWPFPMYQPMGSHTSLVSRKNAAVQSRVRSLVSIGFSCTISEF